jgi:hypothetical protein
VCSKRKHVNGENNVLCSISVKSDHETSIGGKEELIETKSD